MTTSQHDVRGGSSKRAVVSVTASLELRGEYKRASPSAFSAAPHRHRKRKKDRDRRPHQRRGRGRMGASGETVGDASLSPDGHLKSKLRTHRQRPVQKHTVTRHHEVSSCAVIFLVHHSLNRSAITNEREKKKRHCCPHKARNKLVAFWSNAKFVQCRHGLLASRDPWTREKSQGLRQEKRTEAAPTIVESWRDA